MRFDYLIVGAGLHGAVFAELMTQDGKKCLVIDKRPHIASNVYTKDMEYIHVLQYGPHVFYTNDKQI